MAEKNNKGETEKLTSGQQFKKWLWDTETKQFLGRTGGSWLKILVFYIIFYICLAAFWALCLFIFYQTIDPHQPKWKLSESRIGTNPGLGFRPRPPDTKIESTLIWFTSGSQGNYQHWVDDLEKHLRPYTQEGASNKGEAVASSHECEQGRKPEDGKFCPFNYKQLFSNPREECTANNKFGYDKGNPCILIKLNKIYGWEPEPYTDRDLWPKNMPAHNGSYGGIVITCEGENPADKENIGPIRYSPSQTIKASYFPYTNQPGYQAPFVMVQFKHPTRGVLINIECKAWARNILHDRADRLGSVHFELLVD